MVRKVTKAHPAAPRVRRNTKQVETPVDGQKPGPQPKAKKQDAAATTSAAGLAPSGPSIEFGNSKAKWDRRFLDLAILLSGWSKDPSTKVGCVIVGEDREIRSTGFNGFPRGIIDNADRLEDRDKKYPLICHAEENAIMHAARIGVALKKCKAFVTWPPCSRCARSLIQAGVDEVIFPKGIEIPERWAEDFTCSQGMLGEAGVLVREA